jgi:hypothetical protein
MREGGVGVPQTKRRVKVKEKAWAMKKLNPSSHTPYQHSSSLDVNAYHQTNEPLYPIHRTGLNAGVPKRE